MTEYVGAIEKQTLENTVFSAGANHGPVCPVGRDVLAAGRRDWR